MPDNSKNRNLFRASWLAAPACLVMLCASAAWGQSAIATNPAGNDASGKAVDSSHVGSFYAGGASATAVLRGSGDTPFAGGPVFSHNFSNQN